MSDPRLLNDVQLWKARHRWDGPKQAELLDHIDALEAREAKLRELHAPRETGSLMPGCEVVCQHCKDHDLGAYGNYIPWPCPTIKILDGIE
jgi:hypothetical protein